MPKFPLSMDVEILTEYVFLVLLMHRQLHPPAVPCEHKNNCDNFRTIYNLHIQSDRVFPQNVILHNNYLTTYPKEGDIWDF